MSKESCLRKADEHIKEATKAVKTTMFKWKPDWETAAEEYTKAAQQYVLAKEKGKALEAFKQSGKAFEEWGMSKFNAAKAYENASNAARDLKDYEQCSQLVAKSAALYRREGKSDSACTMQEKAAKDAEKAGRFEDAMTLYLDVVEIRETESQIRRIKQPLDRAIQMSIRSRKFKKTIELLNKEATVFISLKDDAMLHRNWLCRIIVQLAAGDFAAADQLYEEAITSSFAVSDEQFAADQLLNAFDEADQEKLSEVSRQQIFSFLSNDVAVLARKLEARGGNGRSQRQAQEFQAKMDAAAPVRAPASAPAPPSVRAPPPSLAAEPTESTASPEAEPEVAAPSGGDTAGEGGAEEDEGSDLDDLL